MALRAGPVERRRESHPPHGNQPIRRVGLTCDNASTAQLGLRGSRPART